MAFAYMDTVTVTGNSALLPSTQTDFPVLVSVTDNSLKTTGNGGSVTSASGFDVRPFSDSGLSSALTYELESYDGSAGTIVMWVKIASMALSGVFYLGIGDSGITTDGSSTSTWDTAYKLVWHLPNGSSLTTLDSTSVGNDGTATNASAVAGKIDGGASISGTGYVDTSDSTGWGMAVLPADITVSIWVNPDATDSDLRALWRTNGGTAAIYKDTDNVIKYYEGSFHSSGVTMVADTWYHVVINQDHFGGVNNVKLYVNGSLVYDDIGLTAYGVTGVKAGGDNFSQNFNGIIDEFRISDIRRSSDWITAEYNSQSDPATFLSHDFQAVGGGGDTNEELLVRLPVRKIRSPQWVGY